MNFGIAPRGDKGVEIAKMGVDLGFALKYLDYSRDHCNPF
jgi:hypothetical protein